MLYQSLPRMLRYPLLALVALLLVTCTKDSLTDAPSIDNELDFRQSEGHFFTTSLKGANEVPPVITNATGSVIVTISPDESAVHYRLSATGFTTPVTQAHFHLAPAGVNGPVVAFLYHISQPAGRSGGVFAQGTITAANLIGPLAGMSITDLIDAIRAGNIYVNVHSTARPPGEIRGQL